MEAFSFLKQRRSGVGAAGANALLNSEATDYDEAETNESNDDGPFFDLEFAIKNDEETLNREAKSELCSDSEQQKRQVGSGYAEAETERDNDIAIASSSNGRADPNLASLSPNNESTLEASAGLDTDGSEAAKPQVHLSLLRSATRLRVFLLRTGRMKANMVAKEKISEDGSKNQQNGEDGGLNVEHKFFAVKLRVEGVPVVSQFTREDSKANKSHQNQPDKRFTRDIMQKYLNKVKPIYIRVSKKYEEKLKLHVRRGTKTTCLSPGVAPRRSPAKSVASAKSDRPVHFPSRLGMVRIGRRGPSIASPVSAAPSKSDDSLIQQQDGIQSAILHCKRSFNGSRDRESSSQSCVC